MTCRCGQLFCYNCGKPGNAYRHKCTFVDAVDDILDNSDVNKDRKKLIRQREHKKATEKEI